MLLAIEEHMKTVVPNHLLGCLLLVGCVGSGPTDATPAVRAVIDAGGDGRADAASLGIGDPCTRPADPVCNRPDATPTDKQGTCGAGLICMAEGCPLGGPGGFCVKDCTREPCPDGSICNLTNLFISEPSGSVQESLCIKGCQRHSECRAKYVCTPEPAGTACEPGRICEQRPQEPAHGGFSPNQPVPMAAGAAYGAEGNLTLDDEGHVAIAEHGIDAPFDSIVAGVAVYTEGRGFDPAVAVGDDSSHYAGDPTVTYDLLAPGPTKPLYVAWLEVDARVPGVGLPSLVRVHVARSDDHGVTFGPTGGVPGTSTRGTIVAETDAFLDKPWIAAAAGHVYVSYQHFLSDPAPNEPGVRVEMVVSDDGGQTWSSPQAIAPDDPNDSIYGQLSIAPATGDLFASTAGIQHISASRWSRRRGEAWFEPPVVVAQGMDNVTAPSSAVSPDGSTVWVVWDQFRSGRNLDLGSDIHAARAAAADGATPLVFEQPVTVNDDTACGRHILPTVAVDAQRRPHLFWIDDRYATNMVSGTVQYAMGSGQAQGLPFSAPVAVSDAPFPFTPERHNKLWLGDYFGVGISHETLYVVWSDPREGSSHYFLSKKELGPLLP
jgi:hypothetical protein